MTDPLRILILEDNPADAELVQFELQEAGFVFTSKVVMTEDAFLKAIQDDCPDLILSDYDLPKYSGALALSEARRRCPDTPFILVTGAVTEDRAIEILTQGAKDYVLKKLLQQRLGPAIRRALAEAEEHRARKQAEAELREAARTLEERVKIRTAELEAEVTARKKTEEALTQTRNILSEGQKIAHIGTFEYIAASQITVWSEEECRIYGLDPAGPSPAYDVMLAKSIHPDDAALLHKTFTTALQNGSVYELEHRIVRPDGSLRWVYDQAHPHFGDDGKLTRYVGVTLDITERKKAEEENQRLLADVRLERDRLLALINSINDEIWFADREMRFTLMNPAATNEFGSVVAGEQQVGKIAANLEVYRPDGTPRPVDEAPPLRALRGEVVSDQEEIVRTPVKGELRTRQVSATPVKDINGAIIGSVSVVRDVTERKRIEEELRKSEERFRGYFELGLIGMAITTMDKGITEVNQTFCEMIGYERSELRQMTWAELTHPDDLAADLVNFNKVLAGEIDGYSIDKRFVRKNGDIIDTTLSVKCVRTADGSVDYFVALIQDITERMEAEKILKERTRELEDANRELESFGYSVSHDLKAPLRAIEGYSRMLVKKDAGKLSEDALHKLDTIRSNVEKMNVLIDDLLSFSKVLKSGFAVLEINMDELVKEVWAEIQKANAERELELKVTDMLPGKGDPILIRQVLFNLISNAVKFTKTRKPGVIEVSSDSEIGNIVYSIKDNGVGFDMAYHSKLFGVFQRLHSGEEYEGTGVGLAIVQRIITRHGGRIWAEAEVDKGATFYFTLPTPRK
jgi:PAS domain S-box-containing protein